jgi:hypothetical protein
VMTIGEVLDQALEPARATSVGATG